MVHLKLTAPDKAALYLTVSVTPTPTFAQTLVNPVKVLTVEGATVVIDNILGVVLIPHFVMVLILILPDTNDPLVYLTAIHTLSGPDASTIVIVVPSNPLHIYLIKSAGAEEVTRYLTVSFGAVKLILEQTLNNPLTVVGADGFVAFIVIVKELCELTPQPFAAATCMVPVDKLLPALVLTVMDVSV